MKDFYTNSAFGEEIRQRGYVIIDCLTPEEVSYLAEMYRASNLESNCGEVQFTHMQPQRQISQKYSEEISRILRPKLDAYFKNYARIVSGFAVKPTDDKNSRIPVHQDWTMVDEASGRFSLNCWLPLTDTGLENGALRVLPGSHKVFSCLRGSPPVSFPWPLAAHEELVGEYMQLQQMRAGQALVYDHRLIHDSLPNYSEDPRITVIFSFHHISDTLVHYYRVPGSDAAKINRYEVTSEFFETENSRTLAMLFGQNKIIKEGDHCRLVDTISYVPSAITEHDLRDILESLPGSRRQPCLPSIVAGGNELKPRSRFRFPFFGAR